MIFKDNLLDAYLTLHGSFILHFGMLVTMFVILGDTSKVANEGLKSRLYWVWLMSLVTHGSCVFV